MKHEFLGFYPLTGSTVILVSITNNLGTPVDPALAPNFRVYENGVLISGALGVLTKIGTHTITGATNASPIQVTAVAHGLQTGDYITIANVSGNSAANGTWTITKVDADHYTLNGSTGSGAYTSGGVGHITGLYGMTLDLESPGGFASGNNYAVFITWTDSAARAMSASFTVT